MTETKININNLIQAEVDRILTKYNKDFLDCDDIMKITCLGRDNVRQLFRSKSFITLQIIIMYIMYMKKLSIGLKFCLIFLFFVIKIIKA